MNRIKLRVRVRFRFLVVNVNHFLNVSEVVSLNVWLISCLDLQLCPLNLWQGG